MPAAELYAPEQYWSLTPEEKDSICNGCGPKRLPGWIVPDTLWGLSITEACNIHDFMYHQGKTIENKNEADRVFLNNMLRMVEAASANPLLRWLRRYRAMSYYNAVKDWGALAFWKSKNPEGTMRPVPI